MISSSLPASRGITLEEGRFKGAEYHLVRIVRDPGDVVVKPYLTEHPAGETLSQMNRAAGAKAIVNGTFFDVGQPGRTVYGEVKTDTQSRQPDMAKKRTYWGVTPTGTMEMGETVPSKGSDDRTVYHIPPSEWDGMQYVLGGGGRLLHEGQKVSEGAGVNDERFQDDVLARRNRAAIGYTADGHQFLMVACDEPGWTPQETADFMQSHGASEAMFLDGGGSTEMIVDGTIVNHLSAGAERSLATGLLAV